MVDNSQRQLHGALLDAEILADVFLLMTGGQTQLFDAANDKDSGIVQQAAERDLNPVNAAGLEAIMATDEELGNHEAFIKMLGEKSGKTPVWSDLATSSRQKA